MFAVIYIKWNANDGINVLLFTHWTCTIKTEAHELSQEFKQRSLLTENTIHMLRTLPKDTHPMTKLSSGILYLQKDSIFASQYSKGCPKIHTGNTHTKML